MIGDGKTRSSSCPRNGLLPFSVYISEGVEAPPGVGGIFKARYESFFFSLGEAGRGCVFDEVAEDDSPPYEKADANGLEYDDEDAGGVEMADVQVDQPCGDTCMWDARLWRAVFDCAGTALSFLNSCKLL